MEIYFDNNLINEDNYMSYEDNFSSFDKQFYLGSVASFEAKLQVPIKLITSTEGVYNDYSKPETVIIVNNGQTLGTLIVDKEEFNDDNTVTLTLVDKLALTSTPLDISSLITYRKEWNAETQEWDETGTGVTAKDLLAYICNYYSIPYTYSSFTNENVMTYSYDNTLTGRDYLSMIAELAGGYIYLNIYGSLSITNYYLIDSFLGELPDQTISGNITTTVQNGKITMQGTATSNSAVTLSINNGETLRPNTPYYIMMKDFDVVEGTGSTEVVTFLRFLDTNSQVINTSITGISLTKGMMYNFTVSSEKTIGKIQFLYVNGRYYNYSFEISTGECPKGVNMEYLDSDDVDEYKLGEKITIERVVYDNGIGVYFESSSDDTLTTLYLEPNNFFLQTMSQQVFNNICNKIIGFSYYNININSSINFVEEGKGNLLLFRTIEDNYVPIFNNFERSYMGEFVGSYKTSFESKRQSETEVIPAEDKINSIKTIINQQEGSLEILAGNTAKLRVDVDKIEGYFTITPGNNKIHNSAFLLPDITWLFTTGSGGYHTNLGDSYNGSLVGITQSLGEIVLQDCIATTTEDNITDLIPGQTYILSFYLTNEENSSFNVRLTSASTDLINETITDEEDMIIHSYTFTALTSSATLQMTNSSGTSKFYDLLLLPGDIVKDWETAPGELYSTTLTMSRNGLRVFSTGSNTLTYLTSDGFIIKNAMLQNGRLIEGDIVTKFDENGTETKQIKTDRIENSGKIISTIVNVDGILHYIEYWKED